MPPIRLKQENSWQTAARLGWNRQQRVKGRRCLEATHILTELRQPISMCSQPYAEDPDLERLESGSGFDPMQLLCSSSMRDGFDQGGLDRLQEKPRLQRSASDLKGSLQTALTRTCSHISSISRSDCIVGAKGMLHALHTTSSGNFEKASYQVETSWQKLMKSKVQQILPRSMVCLFFMNLCLEWYKDWEFHQTEFMKMRIAKYPHRYKDPGFPYFHLLVIFPSSLLAAAGIGTQYAAGILFLDMLQDSCVTIYSGLHRVVQYWLLPDELTAKRLAMLGSIFLLLTNSVRQRHVTSNTVAGTILGEPDQHCRHLRSFVLFISRLALTFLFVTVGLSQIKRYVSRNWALYAKEDFLRRDGHDNNWLIVESLLALPFAFGFRTNYVVPSLAAILCLEAALCWSPLETWPSVQYQSHVRSHFATNIGVAGGLLLLLSQGAGNFTIDNWVKRKKVL